MPRALCKVNPALQHKKLTNRYEKIHQIRADFSFCVFGYSSKYSAKNIFLGRFTAPLFTGTTASETLITVTAKLPEPKILCRYPEAEFSFSIDESTAGN